MIPQEIFTVIVFISGLLTLLLTIGVTDKWEDDMGSCPKLLMPYLFGPFSIMFMSTLKIMGLLLIAKYIYM